MNERDETILRYMHNLDISCEEATQLWEDEQKDNLPDLTAEQKAVVKEMTQADRKKETAPRKRERKQDNIKRRIINKLSIVFGNHTDEYTKDIYSDFTVLNSEREITFKLNGELYKITVSKPRKEN